MLKRHSFTGAIVLTVLLNACAHVPYDTGAGSVNPDNVKLRAYESQIESGRPHKLLDFAGSWINPLSLIGKLLLFTYEATSRFAFATTRGFAHLTK